ncbi:MAG: hypothetical protein ACKVJK_03140 [Methylophagaceae bacterium]|jgi:hypothetical protein|tara:strand:- start:90 stop:347 length:258 start_codon:yes stop_codon:yes gene_type:complete
MAAVDEILLAPESFRTIYLRREDRVIMRTELGQKIIIKRIIPEEWQPYRIFEYEETLNDNKKEIYLFDKDFLPQITKEFVNTISE